MAGGKDGIPDNARPRLSGTDSEKYPLACLCMIHALGC